MSRSWFNLDTTRDFILVLVGALSLAFSLASRSDSPSRRYRLRPRMLCAVACNGSGLKLVDGRRLTIHQHLHEILI